MPGMAMPRPPWDGAVAGYLVMWMAMMVPMMLPSLVPVLQRYRRSVRDVGGRRSHELTALVGLGYFAVWGLLGAAACAAGAGVTAVETRWETTARWLPVAAGVFLLVAGAVQLTPWKTRQLSRWREISRCGGPPAPNGPRAWREGLQLGVRCGLSCGSLMLALLAIGMTDLVAMTAVTLAIFAERLAPAPARVARVVGTVIVAAGVLAIARVQGP